MDSSFSPAPTSPTVHRFSDSNSEHAGFAEVFDQAAIGLAKVGLMGEWLAINDRLCETLGYTREELLIRTFLDVTYPEDLEKDLHLVRQILEGTLKTYHLEKRYITKSGNIIWASLTVSLIRKPSGEPDYFISAVEDITERVQHREEQLRIAQERAASQEIRRSLTFLNQMMENLPNAVIVKDARTLATVHVNRSAESWFKIDRKTAIGKTPDDLWPSDRAIIVLQQDRSALSRGTVGEVFEETIVSGEKTQILRTHKVPILGEDQRPLFLLCVSEDLTPQREYEAQRDVFFTSSLDMCCVADFNGHFTRVNPACQTILGYTPEEFCATPYIELVHPEDIEATIETVRLQLQDRRQIFSFENRYRTKTGDYRWLSWRSIRMGESMYGVARDVTEEKIAHSETRKLLEQEKSELEIRERAAQEASRLKSQFLATISHEMRTPLNGIIGMTDLLLDSKLESTQRDYAETTRCSAEMLLSVIKDVLDFSKIEAGKMDLENADFDLNGLLIEVQKVFDYSAKEKNLELQFIHDPLPGLVRGDAGRIRQVLVNLLSNAIKFTEKGSVQVRVRCLSGGPQDIQVQFEILDTGIGIQAHAIADIFTPFTQAESAITRRFGGTGLGLSISKRLVELMHGQMGVESQSGQGSRFWFSLPLKPVEILNHTRLPSQQNKSLVVNGKPLSILVAEDNLTNQKVVERQLQKLGLSVTFAANGLEAIRTLEQQTFDLILMDLQMPELDGLEATRRIRAGAVAHQRNIPIFAMTANAFQGAKDECMAVGMNGVLLKPVRLGDLADTLEGWQQAALLTSPA